MNRSGCSRQQGCQQGLEALRQALDACLDAWRRAATARLSINSHHPGANRLPSPLKLEGIAPNGWNCWPDDRMGRSRPKRGRDGMADQRKRKLCGSGVGCAGSLGPLLFWRCPAKLAAHPERTVQPLRGRFSGGRSSHAAGWLAAEARRRTIVLLLRLSQLSHVPCREWVWGPARSFWRPDLADDAGPARRSGPFPNLLLKQSAGPTGGSR